MIYLASPYSHPDAAIREERFRAAVRAAAILTEAGSVVFTPIGHYHPIDAHLSPKPPEFWDRMCEAFMNGCDWAVVLCIPGWKESRGVSREIAWFEARTLPVTYMEMP